MKRIIALFSLMAVAACDSFTVAPYGISADNSVALRSIAGNAHARVADFTLAQPFDASCRLAGPIQLPTGLTFVGYIQKAFSDELKVAGVYDPQSPIGLQGVVTDLAFSSNNGVWDIALTINSSNGKSVTASEQYDFHTSFTAISACHNVADAFQPAVQALIGKIVTDPNFHLLFTS